MRRGSRNFYGQFDQETDAEGGVPQSVVPQQVAEEVAREAARDAMAKGSVGLEKAGPPSPALIAAEEFSEGMERIHRNDAVGAKAAALLHRQSGSFIQAWSQAAGSSAGIWSQYRAEEAVKWQLAQEADENSQANVRMRVVPGSADAMAVVTAGLASSKAITIVDAEGKKRALSPGDVTPQDLAKVIASGGTVHFHMSTDRLATFASRTALIGIPTIVNGHEIAAREIDDILKRSRLEVTKALFEGEQGESMLRTIVAKTKDQSLSRLRSQVPLLRQAFAVQSGSMRRDAEVIIPSRLSPDEEVSLRQLFARAAAADLLRRGRNLRAGIQDDRMGIEAPRVGIEAPRVGIPEADEERRERSERIGHFASTMQRIGDGQQIPSSLVAGSVDALIEVDAPRVFPGVAAGVSDPVQAQQVADVVLAATRMPGVTALSKASWAQWASNARESLPDDGAWDPVKQRLEAIVAEERSAVAALHGEAGVSVEASSEVTSFDRYSVRTDAKGQAASEVEQFLDRLNGSGKAIPLGGQVGDGHRMHNFLASAGECAFSSSWDARSERMVTTLDPVWHGEVVAGLEAVARRADLLSPEDLVEAQLLVRRMVESRFWVDEVISPPSQQLYLGESYRRLHALNEAGFLAAPDHGVDLASVEGSMRDLPQEVQRLSNAVAAQWLVKDGWLEGEGIGSSDISGARQDLVRKGYLRVVEGLDGRPVIRMSPDLVDALT